MQLCRDFCFFRHYQGLDGSLWIPQRAEGVSHGS